MDAPGDGLYKVIVVSGLSKNVMKGHLDEIFSEYGRITGIDLPLFKVCKFVMLLFAGQIVASYYVDNVDAD